MSDEDYCTLLFLRSIPDQNVNLTKGKRIGRTSGEGLALVRASKRSFARPSKDFRVVYDFHCESWL